jgi:hypothetical protein
MKDAIVVTLVILLALGSCSRGAFVDESKAISALSTQGYSDIHITKKNWFAPGLFGCSEKDAVKFDAIATNPVGRRVEVSVCTGFLFKGSTIRTY